MKTRTSLNVSSDFRQVSLRFIFRSGRRLPHSHASEIACRLQIHMEHCIFIILPKLAAPFTYAYFSEHMGVSHLTGKKLTTHFPFQPPGSHPPLITLFHLTISPLSLPIILLLIMDSLLEKAYSFPNLSFLSSTPLSLFQSFFHRVT